jgi:hypothetical protein
LVPGYILMFAALVVAGVSLAVQSGAPWAVTGLHPLLLRPQLRARVELTRRNLERVDQAVQALWLSQGSAPAQLDELVQAGLLDSRHLLDGLGRPLQYASTGSGFVVAAVPVDGDEFSGLSIERSLSASAGP